MRKVHKEESVVYVILLMLAVSFIFLRCWFWPFDVDISQTYHTMQDLAHSVVDSENKVISISQFPDNIRIEQEDTEDGLRLEFNDVNWPIRYTVWLSSDFSVQKESGSVPSTFVLSLVPIFQSVFLGISVTLFGTVVIGFFLGMIMLWKEKHSNHNKKT